MERFFRNLKAFAVTAAILFAAVALLIGVASLMTDERLSLPSSTSEAESLPQEDLEPESSADAGAEIKENEESAGSGEPGGDSSADAESAGEDSPSAGSSGEEAGQTVPELPERRGKPDEARAVYLTPGVDYTAGGGEDAVRQSIAEALSNAKNLTMNTVVAVLNADDGPIYETPEVEPAGGLDILKILIEEAHAQDFYVWALFDAAADASGARAETVDLGTIQFAALNAGHFAARYAVDGVLIDGCENETRPDSYARYIRSNSGVGYENYMRSYSETLYCAAARAMKDSGGDDLPVGPVAAGVWENAARDDGGSNTSAAHTLLHDANADVRAWLGGGLCDFVAFLPRGSTESGAEPFQTAVDWWGAEASANGVPLYVLHRSDLICTDAAGYSSPDELAQQVIYARACKGYAGSAFTSLARLDENPQSSTDLLVRLFSGQVNVSHVLTRLAVTQPEQTTFSTFEPVISLRGASDPNFEVSLDGEALERDENGYFSIQKELGAGLNTFTFEHKGKSLVYKITRNVQIVKEVSPTGSVELQGGMKLQVSALAYADAAVSATLGGQSIPLTRDDTIDDSTDAGSAYARFTGSFTVPAATGSRQSLGTVTVSGSWEGVSDSAKGAAVSVLPAVAAGDGDLVVVTADSAKTFPTGVLNNESNPAYFPLPCGTLDYAVGDKLSFTNDSGTYYYYKLQSGLRVYAEDISGTSGELTLGNAISKMKISSDRRFTYVALDTAQPVPYHVAYTGGTLTFDFEYTSSTPSSQKVSGNPVITAADWSGSKLTLKFVRSGSFIGYYAYYEDDGTLVLRLTNPPTSLSGVRVAIDPGHGGKDKGAPGYFPDVSEAEINRFIAEKTAEALQSRGASVRLIETNPYLTLWQRIDAAAAYDADLFISIHSNSSESNPSAAGTEVYYFYSNGQPLASAIAGRVASALGTQNRDAKAAQYVVTSDVRFASVLVETGFISNKGEYKKLIDSSYQSDVAEGIADGIQAYISAVSTGIKGGGDSTDAIDGEEEDEDGKESGTDGKDGEASEAPDEPGGGGHVEEVSLNKEDITMHVGETYTLKAIIVPEDAGDTGVGWQSDDGDIASVSSSGRVEALSPGTTYITAVTDDGELSASCIVRVKGG